MNDQFVSIANLWMAAVNMKEQMLGLYSQSKDSLEEASAKLKRAMPGVTQDNVTALEQQAAMREYDLMICQRLYVVATAHIIAALDEAEKGRVVTEAFAAGMEGEGSENAGDVCS